MTKSRAQVTRDHYLKKKREDPEFLANHAARAKRYREKYPDRVKVTRKNNRANWTLEQKKKESARIQAWRMRNKNKFNAQRREYYERNVLRLRKYFARLYLKNRDELRLKANARYERNNPGPKIRGLIIKLKSGRIDIATAIKQIRALTAIVNGNSDLTIRRISGDEG